MNDRKRLLIAITGVMFLVISIVSSTFAYFYVTLHGTNNAVTTTSLNVVNKITIDEERDPRANLIPITEAGAITAYNQTGTGTKDKCKGVSSNNTTTAFDLCSTYKITITNSVATAIKVKLTLTTITKGFTNLWYCLFTGTSSTITGSCAAVPAVNASVDLINNVAVPASGSVNYTVMLFIKEIDADQTSADAGKTFTGTVTVTTNTGQNIVGSIST